MRKVLLISNEHYLDRALQDVYSLMAFEQQQIGKDEQVDLLAAILLQPSAIAQFTSGEQTCECHCLAFSTTPFTSDSVSVNGVWLLLTVSQPDLPYNVSRQESLSRLLSALRTKEWVQSESTIFPVFSPEEDERSVAEQMAHLQNEYPGLSHLPKIGRPIARRKDARTRDQSDRENGRSSAPLAQIPSNLLKASILVRVL